MLTGQEKIAKARSDEKKQGNYLLENLPLPLFSKEGTKALKAER
jgi:hypothetical protein